MKPNNQILSSICYFSVFFLPFLLPIIIYFIADEDFVKQHAKRALVSHLVPVVLLVAGFIITTFSMVSFDTYIENAWNNNVMMVGFLPVLFLSLYGILFFIVVIWNVIQGVKLLK